MDFVVAVSRPVPRASPVSTFWNLLASGSSMSAINDTLDARTSSGSPTTKHTRSLRVLVISSVDPRDTS
jgi:hypothetical protein